MNALNMKTEGHPQKSCITGVAMHHLLVDLFKLSFAPDLIGHGPRKKDLTSPG